MGLRPKCSQMLFTFEEFRSCTSGAHALAGLMHQLGSCTSGAHALASSCTSWAHALVGIMHQWCSCTSELMHQLGSCTSGAHALVGLMHQRAHALAGLMHQWGFRYMESFITTDNSFNKNEACFLWAFSFYAPQGKNIQSPLCSSIRPHLVRNIRLKLQKKKRNKFLPFDHLSDVSKDILYQLKCIFFVLGPLQKCCSSASNKQHAAKQAEACMVINKIHMKSRLKITVRLFDFVKGARAQKIGLKSTYLKI